LREKYTALREKYTALRGKYAKMRLLIAENTLILAKLGWHVSCETTPHWGAHCPLKKSDS
jgi:hypothetical protein